MFQYQIIFFMNVVTYDVGENTNCYVCEAPSKLKYVNTFLWGIVNQNQLTNSKLATDEIK